MCCRRARAARGASSQTIGVEMSSLIDNMRANMHENRKAMPCAE